MCPVNIPINLGGRKVYCEYMQRNMHFVATVNMPGMSVPMSNNSEEPWGMPRQTICRLDEGHAEMGLLGGALGPSFEVLV